MNIKEIAEEFLQNKEIYKSKYENHVYNRILETAKYVIKYL